MIVRPSPVSTNVHALVASNETSSTASTNSHKISTINLSQLHSQQFRNYQSRQRKHRSSHFNRHTDRSRVKAIKSSNGESDGGHRNRRNNNIVENGIIRIGNGAVDEARYNLATRIMSNGVEVIVAGDKSTLPGGHPNNHLRILTTSDTFKMPLTLAPSTLKDQMHLMLPQTATADDKNDNGGADGHTQVYVSAFLPRSASILIHLFSISY